MLGFLLVVALAVSRGSSDAVQLNKVTAKVGGDSQLPTTVALLPVLSSTPIVTPTPTPMVTSTPEPTPEEVITLVSIEEVVEVEYDITETATTEPFHTPLPTVNLEDQIVFKPTFTPVPPPPLMPTPSGTISYTVKVPILMYHYISYPPEDADKYRLDLSVPPENFRQQLAYLSRNGYESIDLYDLSLAIAGKGELPPKPVIITLDDGYRDNYSNAFPILEEYGMTATIFLVTEFIDRGNENYLDWDMVKEMSAAGNRFEPHSKTHPDLTIQDRAFIIWEVQGSRETIAAHVGTMPRYFAYPSGRTNEEVQQILTELDFWGAVTTGLGQWNGFNDRFEWTRMRVHGDTTLEEFALLVK